MFPIDLKSDTVTRPSQEMRRAMADAEVGDDVYNEDPTVHRLEEKGASLTGKEAALYLASGTMGNIVALLTHCSRGDAAIVGADSHILNYEGGGLSALGGILPLAANDSSGII
ncbi:MAG: threonine aldolase, partial [Synergistaceae bacterium]|nr:threonine aldolase [Synergistaceae bacterium]